MNVKSPGFRENRSFQLKPDSFFGKVVNLVDEANMQNFFCSVQGLLLFL